MDGIDDYRLSGKAKQGDMRGILSGNTPITGTPGGMDAITGIYGQDGNLIAGGDITSDNAFTRTNPPSPTDPSARIGDYVMQPGGAAVVPDSLTDIYQKYIAAYGGSKLRGLSFSDWTNALVKGLSARMGAPTDTSNVVTTAGTAAMSSVLSRIGVVRDLWGIANTISGLQNAQDRYLKDWMDQEIEYDTAADFYVDDNGDLRYKPDYSKMAEAGYGSGSEVLKATDTENSDVALLDDNNLQVNVSPVFANSSAFADIKKQILEAYPNMTREIADTVVSEETGATVLDTIKQYILSQESQFYYNAKSIYDLKQVGPDASMDSLERASYTQLMGAMDKKSLENMTVTVYNRDNQMEELNAKEYLDSIKDMDDRGREEYMLSLGNRIQSDDISDDEKVVLQAQANALYMASNNDGAYKDMYRKGFWDSVADTGGILFGLRLGNMFGVDELTTFEENEFYRGSLDLVTGVGRIFTTAKIMGKLEKFGRAGLTKLGDFVGNNTFGNFLKNINTYSPQGADYRFTDIGKEVLPGNQTLTLGGFLGRTGVQVGTQAVADAAFDLGKMGAYALANEDYDFWDEFGTDFLIDTMLTYGPSAYIESMDRPKYEYRRVGAEGDQYKAEKLEDINRRMEEDEFFDGKYQGPTGVGMYEVKLVEVTADELAKRHAQRIDKLTDTKIGRKVQELFFDKNAAMGKLATQARAAASGDTYYFRKMLRYSGDIRQLTRDVMNEYRGRDAAAKVWTDFYAKLSEVAPKARDFTKADANYINAMANKARFSAEWKGNKEAETAINKFYDAAVKGVSAERAEQLNGLMESMRAIAADGVDFYGERGIFSKKQISDLRKNPVYKNGMYMPVWTKGSRNGDGDIMQSRATTKSVFDPKVLISVEDLENPLVTIASYINNVARNVAINDRALAIREAASLAGVKLHILEDTGGALSEVKNLRELNDAFEKQYQNIVKSVKEAVPTRKQWQKINDKLILDSATMKSAEELDKLKQEAKDLRNELRRTKRAQDKALKIAEAQKAIDEAEQSIAELKKVRADYENQALQLGSIDADFDVAGLSYDERRQLAEDVEHYSRGEKGGLGDYILLYRVQDGKPDKWRPNDHGVKGRFEALGGEEGLKGAVWLTADRAWAEGPERATSGVKDATNENIVVIPVKRSDILPLMQETNAKSELDKSGKKIVQTRGIDGGLKKSEFILWENEHPEIFEDGMDLMLEQYASNQYKKNQRAIRRIEREIAQIDDTIKELEDGLPKVSERWYHRFHKGETPEDAYVEYNPTLNTTFASLYRDFERIDVDDIVRELLGTKRGQDIFEDVALLVGYNPDAVYGEIMRRLESIYADEEITDLISNDRNKEAYRLMDKKADSLFTREQREAFFDKIQEDWPAMVAASRDRMVKMYDDVQPFLNNLGIEAYTKFYEDPEEVSGGRAYGNYWFGDMGRGELDANGRYYEPIVTPQQIRISLSDFENLPGMKSVLMHEGAHAAWSKAANRVPIGQDIFRMLGVKGKVSDELAASRDFSELVAYMTQKKFISEFTNKDRKAAREFFLADTVVQHHLDNILEKVGGKQKISFKERFIDAIRDATLFLKAKIAGARSLRNVTTFADFYNGLMSGEFASDMRVDQTGSKFAATGVYVGMNGKVSPTGDVFFDWSKVPPDAEQLAADIIEIKNKISANKEAQAKLVNEIKDTAEKLMEEAAALNKYNPAKLDIQSYANVELTNNLKKALKSNDPTGQIQAVLNKAIELANPYVTRSSVINKLAEEAAYKFRKKVARDMKVVENVRGKKRVDAANDLIDKVTDEIITKVTGEKKTLTAIDDNELTRILNSNGDPHTIRYMLNGEEQKMILTGKGSEDLVKEFYAPEAKARTGIRRILNLGNKFAQAKRYLTTSADPTRVLPNLARDWSRGIVTTGGDILLSPDQLRTKALETGNYTPEQVAKINNGFELARAAVDESTFTASMQTPKKNRAKSMVRAASEPVDGNAFTRFIWDRTESAGKLMSTLQDMGETFTRRQAMEVAYYKELSNCAARGMSIEDSIKRATEAAYFYGREATVNFFRRGSLIAEIAQQVPYLSQNFASLESFKYAFLDDPIKVTRSLETTVTVYATMIAIALSNDESRKRYYLLTEYDRAHNIIIPLANNMIVTVPLDENVAAFLTPYRRLIETLNGVDPEAFYLWGAEMLEALSPLDLSGFSEGDKFNVVRGFQKIGSQVIPTWAQPILESMTGTDWYYGSNLEVTKDDVGARTDNWDATPGELTTKSKNSEVLAHVADATGIPQWVLQNIYSEYGGNVGQYMLNMIDKLAGATEEAQGGKEFFDSIFKPFTGMDSDEVGNAFWNGINQLDDEKKQLQRELKTLGAKISAATGEEKAELQNKRQEKIRAFGVRVSDFLNQYLSAFEITGGLTKSQANRVWRLYDIYDQNENDMLYREGSPEEYFGNLASKQENKEATNLAGLSGLDRYYHTPADDYNRTYGEQMFRNTIYGQGTQHMANIAEILEDTSDYNNSFTKLRSDAIKARKEAKTDEDWDNYDRIAYQYDYKVLSAIYPYLVEHGVADTLNNNEVIKYLEDWILVPSTEMRTSKGRYVPNLGTDSEKYKAFTKQFVKKMYGVSGE